MTTLCPTTQQYCSRGFEQLYSILITHFIRLILLFIIFIRWADKPVSYTHLTLPTIA